MNQKVKNYFRPISISLSPNVEKDDVKLALNLLIRPWLWKKGKGTKELEESFKNYLGIKYAFSFNSGRSSLFAILKSLELEKGDQVLLQAFTCNAVPNPVLWADLEPVYVDCGDDFNMDISDLTLRLASLSQGRRPKVLVIQHTFGLPANINEIRAICEVNNIILIEDCAHALGAEFNSQKVGTFGKASFFSFSRDKVISSVYGGMVVTNDDDLAKHLLNIQKDFGAPSRYWVFQQILHPILLNYFILPVYGFLDLGKMFLVASQVLHILSKAVSWQEKRGLKPDYFPKALPNAMAMMANHQLSKIEKFNAHRKKVAEYYFRELAGAKFELPARNGFAAGDAGGPKKDNNIFLRFSVKNSKAHEIIYEAWHKQNILLGDWYTTPIAPFDTKMNEMKYKMGDCPNAEYLAKHTLNLPTHINISEKDAERVINLIKKYG